MSEPRRSTRLIKKRVDIPLDDDQGPTKDLGDSDYDENKNNKKKIKSPKRSKRTVNQDAAPAPGPAPASGDDDGDDAQPADDEPVVGFGNPENPEYLIHVKRMKEVSSYSLS